MSFNQVVLLITVFHILDPIVFSILDSLFL